MDVAMDFLNGLDNLRYSDFKVDIINDIAKGAIEQPKTLNDIYLLASRRLVTKKNTNNTISVAFATADKVRPRKGGNPNARDKNGKNDKGKPQGEQPTTNTPKTEPEKDKEARKRAAECYRCGKVGHYARECEADDEDLPPRGNAYATWEIFATNKRQKTLRENEVY